MICQILTFSVSVNGSSILTGVEIPTTDPPTYRGPCLNGRSRHGKTEVLLLIYLFDGYDIWRGIKDRNTGLNST